MIDNQYEVAEVIRNFPPLRVIIANHGLAAYKGLGQHFLLDLNLTRRIVQAAEPLAGLTAIEVGPGPGGLTRAILEAGPEQLIAIERDHRCQAALAPLLDAAKGRFSLILANALTIATHELGYAPRLVIANLPYNIATHLLIKWLKHISAFRVLILMFQKEVAERLMAPVGTKAYGRLTVMTGAVARINRVLTVPASAFTPPPAVESMVVKMTPLNRQLPVCWPFLEHVVAVAFNQRRKMLRSALKSLARPGQTLNSLLDAAGLDPTARPDSIPIDGYLALAAAYQHRCMSEA